MCGDRIRIFANGVSQAGLKWSKVGTDWITGYVRMEQVHLNFEGRLACLRGGPGIKLPDFWNFDLKTFVF